jgi:hypothetical protein
MVMAVVVMEPVALVTLGALALALGLKAVDMGEV